METEELYTYFKECKTVTTDSRKCPHGSLFFALQGNSFDGNAYASAALENGCSYAVIDNPAYRPNGDARYLLVKDSLKALQQLATYHRRIWGKDILQITGTNGKTTTKELVATVLKCRYNLLYTEGNLNNHIGVPLTLLRLTPENDMAVIETGANHPGEIDFLSHIVEPNYGLITNVGKAHLEGFGSFEGVIQTKTELFRYLEQHGPGAVLVLRRTGDAQQPNLFWHVSLPVSCSGGISGPRLCDRPQPSARPFDGAIWVGAVFPAVACVYQRL